MTNTRDYRKEYDTYHGKADQLANRTSRNKARRKLTKVVGSKKLRGKDVDHKNGNPKDNSAGNLQAISKSKNRSKK